MFSQIMRDPGWKGEWVRPQKLMDIAGTVEGFLYIYIYLHIFTVEMFRPKKDASKVSTAPVGAETDRLTTRQILLFCPGWRRASTHPTEGGLPSEQQPPVRWTLLLI